VIPSCSSGQCRIAVIYNRQIPLCDGGSEKCRKLGELCTADPDYSIDEVYILLENNPQAPLWTQLNSGDTFVSLDKLYKGTNGILIRAGDVDNDGYPGLICYGI
jgi:hypothetical protein